MSQSYSSETQKILNDFLAALAKKKSVDTNFLEELRQMTNEGELGYKSRIRKAIAALEGRADELQDR